MTMWTISWTGVVPIADIPTLRWFVNKLDCISGRTREREPGEIIPVSAEQSRTFKDNEKRHAASHAIDLDMKTSSTAVKSSDGTLWLKAKLDNTTCIHQVENKYLRTWTCSSADCSTCEGTDCSDYSLTVSSERTSSDGLPTVADCKYGDTVQIHGLDLIIYVTELVIKVKQGEIIHALYVYWTKCLYMSVCEMQRIYCTAMEENCALWRKIKFALYMYIYIMPLA